MWRPFHNFLTRMKLHYITVASLMTMYFIGSYDERQILTKLHLANIFSLWVSEHNCTIQVRRRYVFITVLYTTKANIVIS